MGIRERGNDRESVSVPQREGTEWYNCYVMMILTSNTKQQNAEMYQLC